MSQLTHHWTYTDVVAAEYGRLGLLALKIAIIINNAGSMVRRVLPRLPACSPWACVCRRGCGCHGTTQLSRATLVLLAFRPGPSSPPSSKTKQIVYLIIIADVLVGVPPDYNGLVTNLLGVHDPHGEGTGCLRTPQR